MKFSEHVHSPDFSWRFMVQEGNCFMLSWPCQPPYPPSDSKCLWLADKMGFEGSWTCQTAFLISDGAGLSNTGCGSCSRMPLWKCCPHWVHSYLEWKYSSVPPDDSLTPPGQPCWPQVDQEPSEETAEAPRMHSSAHCSMSFQQQVPPMHKQSWTLGLAFPYVTPSSGPSSCSWSSAVYLSQRCIKPLREGTDLTMPFNSPTVSDSLLPASVLCTGSALLAQWVSYVQGSELPAPRRVVCPMQWHFFSLHTLFSSEVACLTLTWGIFNTK